MDSLTQSFYARNAERLAGEYDKAAAAIAPGLERTFANCRRILDVGCGSGRDLACLLKLGKDAVGADPVSEMLAAAQRGVPRWEDPACTKLRRTHGASAFVTTKSYPTQSRPNSPSDENAPALIEFSDVQKDAFRSYLPLVASLAAGFPFHGFETASMDDLADLPWIAVPAHLAKPKRYAVRVAGHSMSPTLEDSDVVVFEYHRSPRGDRQIVVANIPEFPDSAHATEAIKRLRQDSTHWIFESDNPQYPPFSVLKSDAAYPILGTFVARMG